jgi:hypothetical protein
MKNRFPLIASDLSGIKEFHHREHRENYNSFRQRKSGIAHPTKELDWLCQNGCSWKITDIALITP